MKLLRVGSPLLFRDDDDLIPGDKWKPTIGTKISECDTFMLFWCWHSKASTPVRGEWKQAIKEGKRIVPVLLDATELPPQLGEFHWIDLSPLTRHRHQKRLQFKVYVTCRLSSDQSLLENGLGLVS